jgi:hypothetical protein
LCSPVDPDTRLLRGVSAELGVSWAWAGTLLLGLLLAVWLGIQAILIGFSAPSQWFTAVLDVVILGTALAPATRQHYRWPRPG